ncbi:snRNA-activating protein complex subunit 4 isoform X1 [Lepeophtheirus salmonis]|uniref:snRNA-activating protein complex subunit 4 isoform X1 n=1 Tax=Lepeophtheirus salmonis TaxID=72036 RepID=UPI001AEA6D20|nr:snRNA-activating protein complex subunit 4-like isoform X1 [Lepeophtheirus salmonis]
MEKKEVKNDDPISFQDIFSENFNSLIYNVDNNDEEDEVDIYADDPSPSHQEISESTNDADPNDVIILDLHKKEKSREEEILVEEEDIPENLPTSYTNAKFLNERYLFKLQEFLDNLISALQANQSRQKELNEEIQNLNDQKTLFKKDLVRKTNSKPRSIIIFCAPYFKDVRMFSHPDNQDTTSRKSLGELSVYTLQPPKWLEMDKIKLKKAVVSDAIYKRSKDFLEELNDINHKLYNAKGISTDELKSMENKISVLTEKIAQIKLIPEDKLLMDPNEEFDWLKISAQTFKGVFNHKCVRCMWMNLIHPSINKKSWSKEEDEILLELAVSYYHKDWDAVARELNTNRPAYLCFVRYQRKHKILEFAHRKWSKEEDLRLCTLVKQCRIYNYIPWLKVSYYMSNGRSKDMCYQRYTFSISEEILKGRFKIEEDFIIILGVHVFGTEWNKIVRFLRNRTCTQVFSRYNSSLSSNLSPWTLKEDKTLLQTIKTMGTKNWKNISDILTSRTRYQCRRRFDAIYNVYRKDPKSFDLEKCMKYSDNCFSLSKRKQDYFFTRLDELLKNCLEAEGIVLSENEPIPRDFLLRVMTILSDKLAYGTGETSLGTNVVVLKKGKSVTLSPKELKIRNDYNDFFRKNISNPQGRERVRFKENEMTTLGLIGTSIWNLLDCKNHLNLNEMFFKGASEKDHQLFDIIKSCPKEFVKDESSSLQPQKPLLKTYSRKNSLIHKNSQSRISSKKTSEVSPPTTSSCIALRYILSFLTDLNSRSNGPWKKESKKALEKSRTEGIFAEKFAEMFWALGLNKLNSTSSEADNLLNDRFISVFFWPAVLSTIRSKRFDDIASLQEGSNSILSSPSKSKRIKLMSPKK